MLRLACRFAPILVSFFLTPASAVEFASHPPTRPLPQASSRPRADGPAKFVDTAKGDDANDGGEAKPWKTLAHAVTKLAAGDTLYLRGGTYFEHVAAKLIGTADKPITIRAYPGELVTLDGGLPEFQLSPTTSWEPCPDGVAGEFHSTKTYPGIESVGGDLHVDLLGRFVDSLQPLHGYWHHPDLQSDNPYWTLGSGEKVKPDAHVYCGPGLWYDRQTDRIHVRLAHTKLPGLGDDNYRGETDPRKIPLIVVGGGHGPVLTLKDCRHVRLQDLVIRGARTEPLSVDGGGNIELDGLTLYGGGSCLRAASVTGLRMANTACRGVAAPWTFRGSLKYRSIEARLVRTGGWEPTGRDGRMYEFAYCEFTDSVDGVFIGNIAAVFFHHNLIENVSDDAIFVTANTGYDGKTNGGGSMFYQNRFAQNLTCFAFGVGHGRQKTIADGERLATTKRQLGGGLKIYRNVFDFRRPVMYHWPSGPDDVQEITSLGRLTGDHGSPAWEEMEIYHNTLVTGDPPRYEYGTDGFTRAMAGGTTRQIYNNLVCQLHGLPGTYFPPGDVNYFAGWNLLWSVSDGPALVAGKTGSPSPLAVLPKAKYSRDQTPPDPRWGTGDVFADPRFVGFDADWRKPVDLRLQNESPAVNAGMKHELRGLKTAYFDVIADQADAGAPDIGALPLGVEPWRIGCYGRLDVNGNPSTATDPIVIDWKRPEDWAQPLAERAPGKPAAVVTGYPAFEAPLVAYALRKAGADVVELDKQWLDPREYANYSTVVVDGSFARAKLARDRYLPDDLPHVKKFLADGGTLWLFRERQDLFADLEAKRLLYDLTGGATTDRSIEYAVKLPEHPWVKHLASSGPPDWLTKNVKPLSITKGEAILGTKVTNAALGRVPVGKGQILYVGWSPAASLPGGRTMATVAEERRFEEQMQILSNIAESLYPTKK